MVRWLQTLLLKSSLFLNAKRLFEIEHQAEQSACGMSSNLSEDDCFKFHCNIKLSLFGISETVKKHKTIFYVSFRLQVFI